MAVISSIASGAERKSIYLWCKEMTNKDLDKEILIAVDDAVELRAVLREVIVEELRAFAQDFEKKYQKSLKEREIQ